MAIIFLNDIEQLFSVTCKLYLFLCSFNSMIPNLKRIKATQKHFTFTTSRYDQK